MALAQDPQAASEVSASLKEVQKFCKKYEETYNSNEAVLKVSFLKTFFSLAKLNIKITLFVKEHECFIS